MSCRERISIDPTRTVHQKYAGAGQRDRRRRRRRQIIEAWPYLMHDDVKAALKFAAEAVSNSGFVLVEKGI